MSNFKKLCCILFTLCCLPNAQDTKKLPLVSPKQVCQHNENNGFWQNDDLTPCNIKVEDGYKIRIIIEKFFINSGDLSMVSITPGGSSDGKKLILTWNVTKETYLFPTNTLLFEFTNNHEKKLKSEEGFSIYWEKFGNKTVTTEAPSTTQSYPTINPNSTEPYYYTAYLFGKNPKEFTQDVIKFKTLLVDKGNLYCKQNNIQLLKNLTISSIDITLAIRCLYLWPNAEKCVEIHFAIPVFVENSKEYELSYKHLKDLWAEISDGDLKKYTGWTKYSTPDDSFTLTTWLLLCFGIIFVAFIIFFVLQFLGVFKFNKREELAEEIQIPQNQPDISNFVPTTPQNFENENGYVYQQVYAVDNPAYDDSEEERFNVTRVRHQARPNGRVVE